MTVDPGYKYVEKFCGGISWFMMQSKDNNPSICFKLKNENKSTSIIQRTKYNFSFIYQRSLGDGYIQLYL